MHISSNKYTLYVDQVRTRQASKGNIIGLDAFMILRFVFDVSEVNLPSKTAVVTLQ